MSEAFATIFAGLPELTLEELTALKAPVALKLPQKFTRTTQPKRLIYPVMATSAIPGLGVLFRQVMTRG